MVLQIVTKLYESLKKNIHQRSSYHIYHAETFKVEIKGTKNKT